MASILSVLAGFGKVSKENKLYTLIPEINVEVYVGMLMTELLSSISKARAYNKFTVSFDDNGMLNLSWRDWSYKVKRNGAYVSGFQVMSKDEDFSNVSVDGYVLLRNKFGIVEPKKSSIEGVVEVYNSDELGVEVIRTNKGTAQVEISYIRGIGKTRTSTERRNENRTKERLAAYNASVNYIQSIKAQGRRNCRADDSVANLEVVEKCYRELSKEYGICMEMYRESVLDYGNATLEQLLGCGYLRKEDDGTYSLVECSSKGDRKLEVKEVKGVATSSGKKDSVVTWSVCNSVDKAYWQASDWCEATEEECKILRRMYATLQKYREKLK